VNATSFVAVAGAISTPVVALAGYWFNERRGRDDRAAGRELAKDTHEHERELARAAHDDERKLARDARVSADVRMVYEELLRFVFLLEDAINRTKPIIAPAPSPPPMPPEDEVREVMARVSTVASEEVVAEIDVLWAAQRQFVILSRANDLKGVHEARELFREHVKALERAIRAEVRA
jgi:hypothetical protein